MKLFRLLYIGFICARYRIDGIILTTPWFYPFRLLRFLNPFQYFAYKKLSRGERLRLAIEKLGPIFIKFGQILSTRRDFLPEDIADELAKLQDKVPPFSSEKAIKSIERSLKQPLNEVFKQFDRQPLASASIAQVHAAVLQDDSNVVVKVLRPKVKKLIHRDIALLKFAARFMQNVLPSGQRIKPLEIIKEFERGLNSELDLYREAANAAQLKRNFKDDKLAYIPNIFWNFSRKRMLVLERIDGIPVSHLQELTQQQFNLSKLAEDIITVFFTQVFRDNFFHGDMHPGNIFVAKDQPQNPHFILVDFGIAGTLTPSDQRYIAENLLAFFKRDYQRVAQLHHDSGWLPVTESVEEFAGAIRTISEPFFEKPLKEISIGTLLLHLFQTARAYQINIQPQLILLQKNLLHVEGISRQLNPDLDLWKTAKPFLEDWLKTQIGPRALLSKICQQLPYWTEKLPEIPELVYNFLQQNAAPTTKEIQTPKQNTSKITLSSTGGALLLASALIFALAPSAIIPGWILLGLGSGSLAAGLLS